jgi:hypothetical protein
MHKQAVKTDWQTKPISQKQKTLACRQEFTSEEYAKLQLGVIPEQMEDKWFIYFSNNKLYFHRSWTGFCIYLVDIEAVEDGFYQTSKVIVNRNQKEYTETDDEKDTEILSFLINRLLLKKNSPSPCNNALESWSLFGKASYDDRQIEVEATGNMSEDRKYRFYGVEGEMTVYPPDSGFDLTDEEMEEEVEHNMSLEDRENQFSNYYRGLSRQFTQCYDDILGNNNLSLNGNDVTKAIILRLKTYYETQDEIMKFLGKKSVAPASDFFVETVVFYLKLLLEQSKSRLKIKSEARFYTKNSYIKPDISLWDGKKVVAIIECKTNLGFARKKWEADFKAREKDLKIAFPKAKAFLLVLSSKNWSGFATNDKKVGIQYFSLSTTSLRKIKDKPLDTVIKNKIEPLFKQLLTLAK